MKTTYASLGDRCLFCGRQFRPGERVRWAHGGPDVLLCCWNGIACSARAEAQDAAKWAAESEDEPEAELTRAEWEREQAFEEADRQWTDRE